MAKPRDSESVPFSDGNPIEAAVLYKLLGDSGDEERVDGPKPADSPSSSGGKRDIEANPDERSHLQQLEDLVASEFLWELIEKLEEFHNTRRPAHRRGRKRGYNLMDIQILETGTHLYDNPSDVQRNLRNDRKNWKRLRRAAKKAFPNNKSRRLSKTAPSRHQVYRACRDYFSGDALAEFRRWYRRTAVQIAKDIGIFDPKAGSWTHPHKSQSMVGDMTWMRGATQFHRDKPFIPGTGKARRFDPHADYHHTSDGKPTKVPGRELVMLSCRTGYGNERIPTDAEFMPRKKSPLRKGRNEADQSLDMLERLLDETRDLLCGGMKCFIHDMAIDSEALDRALNDRLLPIAKTPKLAEGKYRHDNLGPHKFTTPSGRTETHDAKTCNGSVWVLLPNSRGKEVAVPLQRAHFYWGTEGKERSIAYCEVAIPHHPDVPASLRGATTVVRLNSTDEEIHNTPHTRRTRSLRPIPEADPDFKIYGGREDIESLFSDLKRHTRGKLCSIDEDRNLFNIFSYMILRLSRSLNAYHKRTATTATHAVPIAA